jgi:cytochrome P450
MEATIRRRTASVLDGLPRGQPFDWVDRVSTELTAMMLATLFDFPWEDRRQLTHWSDVAIANIEAEDAVVKSEAERMAELRQMGATMAALWKERASQPPKFDLISMMAHAEATQNMPFNEFIGTFGLLIVGGNDTTRNSMTGGLIAVLDNPDELAKVKADAGLLDSLVAEIIRWQTPVIHMRRTATRDAELAGKSIKQGDKVVMWYVSGNRDEAAIEEPERFRVGRPKARQHLAFGAGIHRCVGDRLAEMQLKILWEEILKRDLVLEVAGPPVRLYSNFIRGIRSLPVVIRA